MLYPFVLLQSSDYSPQQEALLKKQAATLEEIKALTNQVHTLTAEHTLGFDTWEDVTST